MDKSEKSFYVIIKNKKCGKFSGAGPIQVAKKVASKKLKSGKEMTFYLDEVCGKKKRYGPYQAQKDKKSGKVAVVKSGKVMKGGLLSSSDMYNLREIFDRDFLVLGNHSYFAVLLQMFVHLKYQTLNQDIRIFL